MNGLLGCHIIWFHSWVWFGETRFLHLCSFTLKMEPVCSSEMFVPIYQTTRCHILEDGYFRMHWYDKPRFHSIFISFIRLLQSVRLLPSTATGQRHYHRVCGFLRERSQQQTWPICNAQQSSHWQWQNSLLEDQIFIVMHYRTGLFRALEVKVC